MKLLCFPRFSEAWGNSRGSLSTGEFSLGSHAGFVELPCPLRAVESEWLFGRLGAPAYSRVGRARYERRWEGGQLAVQGSPA